MVHLIRIEGEGCKLTLELIEWENPEWETDEGPRWIQGRVELLAGIKGEFVARRPVSVRTDELTVFRDQLFALQDELNGKATLQSIDYEFGAEVELRNGKGEMTAFVPEMFLGELRCAGVPTDQSYLAMTLCDVNGAIAAFPGHGGTERSG